MCTPQEGVANSLVTWSEDSRETTGASAALTKPAISWRHWEFDKLVRFSKQHSLFPKKFVRDLPTLTPVEGVILDLGGGAKPAEF